MAKITHCIRGHLFDDENTYFTKGGSPTCRACRRKARRDASRQRNYAHTVEIGEREAILSGRDMRSKKEIAAVESILARMVLAIDRACEKKAPLRDRLVMQINVMETRYARTCIPLEEAKITWKANAQERK